MSERTKLERVKVVDSVIVRIADLIPEAKIQPPDVDQDLREFAGFDSLGILELLVWLESEFSITIPDEELIVDHFTTINMMADYVLAHQ